METKQTHKVESEFSDTIDGLKWRLKKGTESSPWYRLYEGILTYTFKDGTKWGLVTAYWDGTLPAEVPFQIIEQL